MDLQFLGGCREVGRSALLVKGNSTFLLDCGVDVGEGKKPLIERADDIDYVIITHAHLDHCGFLPYLIKMGFKGKIFSTKPTRDLVQLLLSDYLRVLKKRGEELEFGEKEIRDVLKRFEFLDFWKKTKVGDAWITLYRAGHILGASMIRLEMDGKALLYTGDISVRESNLLYGCDTQVEDVDFLIMESTYGGKNDRIPSLKESGRKIADIVKETLEMGGFVLIPSFGVGRSQEVQVILQNYQRSKYLPSFPIYLDGMIKKANRIYRNNVLFLKESVWKRILIARDDPFESPILKIPRRLDRKDVMKEPAIILTTSGMLTGGPVLTYLKMLAEDSKNALIIVGYQAHGTLGRALVEGERKIELEGQEIEVKMNVHNIHLSGHSDRPELIRFAKKIGPKKIFVMHGEEGKAIDLGNALMERGFETEVPRNGEQFKL